LAKKSERARDSQRLANLIHRKIVTTADMAPADTAEGMAADMVKVAGTVRSSAAFSTDRLAA